MSTEATDEEKQNESQLNKFEETLKSINKMENNLQSLIDLNKVNTLQLMLKMDDNSLYPSLDNITEDIIKDSLKEMSTAVWQPPNAKHCAMAATNPIPYTKNKLSVPSKTSVVGIIINSKYWDRFFEPKIAPKHGDWLSEKVQDRKGQTFLEFYNRKPRYPSNKLDTIGLITIGNFNINLDLIKETKINNNKDNKADDNDYKEQKIDNDADDDEIGENNLFTMLSSIVAVFYGMKVEIIDSIKSNDITSRHNNGTGTKQLLTTDIHEKLSVIKEKNSKLFCLMGVSIIDLYPKPSWNFVYGQARIKAGTGVFSFARYIPEFGEIKMLQYECGYGHGLQSVDVNKIKLLKKLVEGEETDKNILKTLEFDRKTQISFFRRCIKVLVHEIGHLFGLKHCIYMECIMNGSNHNEEADLKPVYLCPVCLHKLYFSRLKKEKQNKPLDLLERYKKLAQFYQQYGLINDAKWYKQRVQFIMEQMK